MTDEALRRGSMRPRAPRALYRFKLRYVLGTALFGEVIALVIWIDNQLIGAEGLALQDIEPVTGAWLLIGYPLWFGGLVFVVQLVRWLLERGAAYYSRIT